MPKYPINSIPKVNPPTQVILNSDFGETFNERQLDQARTTIYGGDILGDLNTQSKQGMKYHNLNAANMGQTEMGENRPQTKGTTYPNTTDISVRNTKIKQQGANYGQR